MKLTKENVLTYAVSRGLITTGKVTTTLNMYEPFNVQKLLHVEIIVNDTVTTLVCWIENGEIYGEY